MKELIQGSKELREFLKESNTEQEKKYEKPSGIMGYIISIVAIALGIFHIYTGGYRPLPAYQQRVVHLCSILVITFLLRPYKKERKAFWIDICFSGAAALVGFYLFFESDDILDRIGIPTLFDIVAGGLLILLVLEATRRVLGFAMPIIGAIFLLYGFFGHLAPKALIHKGYDIERIISQMSLALEGILGIPIGVSATYVILFIIFATFLSECGAGQFFLDISMALFGRFRGGPAKVSVMSSSLFGTISGSAAANVVVDGWLTIPLMKRIGFKPHVAGAIEAVNSTGGQIMPPVMGAAAFIMAEILGIPYIKICIAALVPAILYYIACYFMIDFEALRSGIKGLPREELPKIKEVFKQGFFYLLPIIVLIFFLSVIMYTPMKSAVYAIGAAILVSFFKKSTRLNLVKVLKTIERGVLSSIEVAMACSCAGIIIGIFNLTGFGIRLSTILIEASQGALPVLLILTMIASLILGMGLPTTACYIILAVLVAPAMVKMGVLPLAAHLFVFYFGIISAITPPVAVAAYAGAGIANAPPGKTGFTAWKLAIAGFILPYMFIYGPEILLVGKWVNIILAIITSIVGIILLAASVQGYFIRRVKIWERVMLFIAALLLIKPGVLTDLLGTSMGLIVLIIQIFSKER